MSKFIAWAGRGFVGIVAVGAVLVLIVGPKDTASLYGTAATVGGVSTGISAGSLAAYFGSIDDGFAVVKTDGADVTAWNALGEDPDKKKG